MKRKASVFEEPIASSDWPSMDYSPSCSNTTSPESIKAIAGHERLTTQWNIDTVPYTNLRTLKRHRDNRPDAETIHQNTLAKLFGAQRHMHTEGQQQQEKTTWQMGPWAVPGEMMDHTPTIFRRTKPKSNQRSINSFFGGNALAGHFEAQDSHAERSLHLHNITQSTEECDGCGGPLQHSDGDPGHHGEMDLDMDFRSDDCVCVLCSKRVCDMCAVRGDHRVCLECAVPGAG